MVRRVMMLGCGLLTIGGGVGFSAFAEAGSDGGSKPALAAKTPVQVVAAAQPGEWIAIPAEDLLILELSPAVAVPLQEAAPEAASVEKPKGGEAVAAPSSPVAQRDSITPRDIVVTGPVAPAIALQRVVIQLIGPPYSQGWVSNIRLLAAQHWWDGLAIVRVQDNYVVQWGDPDAAEPGLARALPSHLQKMPPADYVAGKPGECGRFAEICPPQSLGYFTTDAIKDAYADSAGFVAGWPVAVRGARSWPAHCYGTVGVGRENSPDTGSGAELYAVIGQAPRQLDRNIAVVGRVIEGMEHLSSLPRGTGDLGFYEKAEQRARIVSIRRGSDVPDLPGFEYLSTTSPSFATYVQARANRQDAFYVQPAGGVDVCNVPVPVRRVAVPEVASVKKRR